MFSLGVPRINVIFPPVNGSWSSPVGVIGEVEVDFGAARAAARTAPDLAIFASLQREHQIFLDVQSWTRGVHQCFPRGVKLKRPYFHTGSVSLCFFLRRGVVDVMGIFALPYSPPINSTLPHDTALEEVQVLESPIECRALVRVKCRVQISWAGTDNPKVNIGFPG